MTHKRRSSNNNDDDNLENSRQNLSRRCKGIQPYHGVDLLLVGEESDGSRIQREKVLALAAPSTKQAQGSQGRQPRRKITIAAIEKPKDKEEMIDYPTSVVSWLIEMKVVKEDEKVTYCNGTQKGMARNGKLAKQGIRCDCCTITFSISNFLRHIDGLGLEKPYENIFIKDTGVSLFTCLMEAWNKHSVPARSGYVHVVKRPRVRDHYDDCCVICADGGDLLCCEKCPSTYHPKCMGFKDLPQGKWHCPYCHCKHCNQDTLDDLLLTCLQCSKKFHPCCAKENGKIDTWIPPRNIPFCEKRCYKVYQGLKERLGKRIEMKNGYSWTLVRRIDMNFEGENFEEEDYDDLYMKTMCNSLVVLTSRLMEKSFKVIIDRQTRTNLIEGVVYNCGSNFTRINFSRFYTAILELDDEIISVASLRMPSPKIAEIPFIATGEKHRNKGMCRTLLRLIESTLADLGAECIIIPSAEEMVRHWQQKFGFKPLDEAVKTELIKLNTLMFPKTTRLQKLIPNRKIFGLHDLNSPPPKEEQIVN